MAKRYWLMKSEPEVYSIDDLERDGSTCWEGVRNYQARNNMQNPPGIVGIARVRKEAYPDHYAFDEGHKYFDAKSDPSAPRWYMVDIEFVGKLPEMVSLHEVKDTKALEDMELVRYGRLSVQEVKRDEFELVKKMGGL